jgi:hypothetical protein
MYGSVSRNGGVLTFRVRDPKLHVFVPVRYARVRSLTRSPPDALSWLTSTKRGHQVRRRAVLVDDQAPRVPGCGRCILMAVIWALPRAVADSRLPLTTSALSGLGYGKAHRTRRAGAIPQAGVSSCARAMPAGVPRTRGEVRGTVASSSARAKPHPGSLHRRSASLGPGPRTPTATGGNWPRPQTRQKAVLSILSKENLLDDLRS